MSCRQGDSFILRHCHPMQDARSMQEQKQKKSPKPKPGLLVVGLRGLSFCTISHPNYCGHPNWWISQIFQESKNNCCVTMKTATLHFLLIAAILQLLVSAPSSLAQLEDDNENCQGWADNGECSLNPKYMLENW